jgi:hypothetical protein
MGAWLNPSRRADERPRMHSIAQLHHRGRQERCSTLKGQVQPSASSRQDLHRSDICQVLFIVILLVASERWLILSVGLLCSGS